MGNHKKVPSLAEDMTNITNYVPVAAILGRQQVARPDIMPTGGKCAPHDAREFAADQYTKRGHRRSLRFHASKSHRNCCHASAALPGVLSSDLDVTPHNERTFCAHRSSVSGLSSPWSASRYALKAGSERFHRTFSREVLFRRIGRLCFGSQRLQWRDLPTGAKTAPFWRIYDKPLFSHHSRLDQTRNSPQFAHRPVCAVTSSPSPSAAIAHPLRRRDVVEHSRMASMRRDILTPHPASGSHERVARTSPKTACLSRDRKASDRHRRRL